MDTNDYLEAVLTDQNLPEDGQELQALRARRAEVEDVLRKGFDGCAPRIRYAGSYKKGTLDRESYDLDVAFFFPSDEDGAGETLEEIYRNTQKVLMGTYAVEAKTSVIRLRSMSSTGPWDLHIDVLPGRFTDESEGDCFLYQANAEKCRLKTNLDVQIAHVQNSGVIPAIRLLKLWKVRRMLGLKQFIFELLVIKELRSVRKDSLADQLVHFWQVLRDTDEPIAIEDPANPYGNDLSGLLAAAWPDLSQAAATTLRQLDRFGWQQIFGAVSRSAALDTSEKLRRAAASVATPTKPWLP
jgi:hypothetical protein